MSAATVLVADDSLLIRAVVRAELEGEGYRVVEAVDGTAAIEHCREQPPDVVLLDIEMPGLDGYQVLAVLKDNENLKDIPVVFLTGRTATHDLVAGLRGGAHDYLRKPFESEELLARVGSAAHVKLLQDQLRERNEELDRVSRTDPLTGLYNRRHLDQELARTQSEARRRGEPMSVLMLDIDHFKRVNDTHGHPAGDLVLQAFARRLQDTLRAGDIAGRWGGEEFLLILPRTDLDGAREVGERLRGAVDASPVIADECPVRVTVSGGCASGLINDDTDLVALADSCLYLAKSEGRNRIVGAAAIATPD
jgi:two-component system, cell cycle response regulator